MFTLISSSHGGVVLGTRHAKHAIPKLSRPLPRDNVHWRFDFGENANEMPMYLAIEQGEE